ncbi:MAG TPA: right-handed parallel beta-helix repeat-containing protein [Pyrinomonadaceae bacterium]|nr:right-handed parallel beta-helix repeat-containing protein [Pyrinomonadaceae bacterium]
MLPFAPRLRTAFQGVRPRRTADATSRTLRLKAGHNLQRALDASQPGDTIVLEAGATYVGPFTLPNKSGSSYITIQSSGLTLLPADGQRVTPANASAMPKLVSPGSGSPVLQTASAAHHFRFVGIEVMPRDAAAFVYDLIVLGTGTQTLAEVPHHFIFDRCYIHAYPNQGVKRGIALNSAFTEIRNSYISDFKVVGQDSQAICGWNGPGPFQIVNNYLEAAGENIMFGGADISIPGLVPSDIEIRRNHLYKPLSWRVGDPSYAGTHWSVKNLFELKNAQRVVADGNLFENNWGDAQNGFAVLLTPRAGAASWTVVQDVQFTNNIIRHSGSGMQMLGRDTYGVSQQSKRITIENNLFEDIDGPKWAGEGKFVVMGGGGDQITFNHNTILQSGNIMSVYGAPTTNFVFTNNIVPHNSYGITGDGKAPGLETLNVYLPNSIFKKNVVVATGDQSAWEALYPPGNYFIPSFATVKFVDAVRGNYRLAGDSPFRGRGTGKSNIGCNFDSPGFGGSQ